MDKYTLLYFSQKLLHWKTKQNKTNDLVSIDLILADKVIFLCNWPVNLVDFFHINDRLPWVITLSCTKGGRLQESWLYSSAAHAGKP